MPPQKKKGPPLCQICSEQTCKYTCPQCRIVYCSLGCYKTHKGSSCKDVIGSSVEQSESECLPTGESSQNVLDENPVPTSLRPLTSLKWPYVPEESAFPDPLKRDDPKPLQLPQYEAIATSPVIREVLASHKQLPALLASLDKLRGEERQYALQAALGVTAEQLNNQAEVGGLTGAVFSDDTLAFRTLAEAIEAAVRGGKEGVLGLDWGD